jgi:hypothetical protein
LEEQLGSEWIISTPADAPVSVHPLYRALRTAAVERQRAYRALFRPSLDAGFVDALRAATNGLFD